MSRRSERLETGWEVIGDYVSETAARIDCTPAEYRAGLRSIIERLKVDIRASEESSGGDDDDADTENDYLEPEDDE